MTRSRIGRSALPSRLIRRRRFFIHSKQNKEHQKQDGRINRIQSIFILTILPSCFYFF